VNSVPAGGRNPTPPRKAIVFTRQTRNKPLSNMAMEMVLRRMKVEDATFTASAPASGIGRATSQTSRAKSPRRRWHMSSATRLSKHIAAATHWKGSLGVAP